MDWTQVITIVGSNLALFLWARTESRADYRALEAWTKDMMATIQAEMKDFHGKLERQDAEFKGKLAMQDQEFKGKLALQDQEFKAHIMYFHEERNKK
jgi:hypothetical protein